jgi:hypothetical protein
LKAIVEKATSFFYHNDPYAAAEPLNFWMAY